MRREYGLLRPDMMCRRCDSKVACFSKSESTYFTLIAACIVILVCGIWSFCVLPFAVPLSKAIVVRCAKCSTKLETKQPFGLFSLQDEIFTLKFGDCIIVMTRTYFLVGLLVILSILTYYWYGSITPPREVVYSDATWEEYIKDCGMEVVLVNSIRASQVFKQKYEGKTVNWDGYLVKATENPGGYIFRGDHAAVILIKMLPSESDIHADLILTMDDSILWSQIDVLKTLKKGDHVKFEAEFINIGNENMLHHFHTNNIQKLDGFFPIADHVHVVNQRYNVNNAPSKILALENND